MRNNIECGPVVKVLFKDISIFSSGGHFVQWKGRV